MSSTNAQQTRSSIDPAAVVKTIIVDALIRIPSVRLQAVSAQAVGFFWKGFRGA
jgi:hypothetical protein